MANLYNMLTPEQQKNISDSIFGMSPKITAPPATVITPAPLPAPQTIGLTQNERDLNDLNTAYARQQAKVNAARDAESSLFQQLLNTRKEDVQKERTNNIRMASFNSLGNALRTLAQPIGWAAGGATAGVQPYDNRQYLESFNRAVKAGEDLRNIGNLDMQFQLDMARRNTTDAEQELASLRREKASVEDFGKKMADKLIANNKTEIEKRRTIAIKSYYELMKSDSIHKGGYPSFRDFISLAGYGKELFGDMDLSDEEVKAIAEAGGLTATGKPERHVAKSSGGKSGGSTNNNGGGKSGGFVIEKKGGFQ